MAWGIQALEMLAAGLITALCAGLHPAVYGALLWCVMPLLSGVSACAAVRRGLSNYLGWIAPPVCLYISHYALWGYAPSAGGALLCAFIALVGAATGEVYRQRARKKNGRMEETPWKRT